MKDSVENVFAIGGFFGFNSPFLDLSSRFGVGNNAGGSIFMKNKRNFSLEVNYGYFFGNTVKEDSILNNLKTSQGYLLGQEGQVVDAFLFQRGFNLNFRVGKQFNVVGPNPNCGLLIQVGAGIMQHKIKIETYTEIIPSLENDYAKGYDRLTNGFATMQSFGYQHFSSKKFINYYVGLEFHQGFTKSRRSMDFSTEVLDHPNRLDFMGVLVLKWYFPIYKRQARDFYFY